MTDLLDYWNLRERPFEATWDTRFYFQSRDHDEALSRLGFLVGEQTMNMGMLTGEIGCGKTLTRAVFAERLDRRRFEVVTHENSGFAFKDLLGAILHTLDPDGKGESKYARCQRLERIARKLHSDGRHLVLVFDEAQEMSGAGLNELKMLTNWNREGQGVLTVLLLGQPELRSRVAKWPAIDQRISLRFHLNALTQPEVGAYLCHRLQAAGHPTGQLFPPDTVDRLFQVSRGIPREINRLAKLALELAWLREMPCIPLPVIDAVIRDLSRNQTLCPA